MEEIKQSIIEFYKNYSIDFEITKTVKSYAVTRYFIKLDRTTKNKLANVEKLVDDLAVELNIKNIVFKNNFFEIPNKRRKTLKINDLGYYMPDEKKGLYVPFGKDLNNKTYTVNLCETPHLLVAGTTGSGKSVFINCILSTLIRNYDKDYLQLSLIDPKKVELSIYKNAKQVKEIATNLQEARNILENALTEIDNRYKTLELSNCRNIESYNNKNTYNKMKYNVIVVDELADVILQDRKESKDRLKRGEISSNSLEAMLCRIAQIGRACGVHLIVATQRPSSDIITGLIKANFPSRVAFSVSSRIDSRVILDDKGAEKLTGKGDMLFKMVGDEELNRLQGAFITDEEIENVVNENKDIEELKQEEVQKLAQTLNNVKSQKEQKQKQKPKYINGQSGFDIGFEAFCEWLGLALSAIGGCVIPFLILFLICSPLAILLLTIGLLIIILSLPWKISDELKKNRIN